MIPEDKIAEIRERTDLLALVQEYVPLRRVGASFKGLCPFHAEKTPSFYVHPARQFFHCFGCQASGDSLAFYMRVEGRLFPEALRFLAERAGIELPVVDRVEEAAHQQARARRERLEALMEAAAGFYVKQLKQHPLGAMARAELEHRGVLPATADAFRLGYAPHGWDALTKWLREQGWSPAEAEAVGLIVPRRSSDGYYDRFRHRLLFPVADPNGRIVAFSGRVLDPPPDEPLSDRSDADAKYVNSPEGPLFKKGDVLFGLHEGRVAIRRQKWCLICEGNFDLLALHQAGLQNAVAPLGTALTKGHVKQLRRFAERVVLLFDGDSAGRKAVRTAWPLLAEASLPVSVVTLPPGSDPDSFLRASGPAALTDLLAQAPSLVEHLIEDAAEEAGGDPARRAAGIESLGPVLASVANPVEIDLYIERIARKFGVSDPRSVRQQLRRGVRASRGARSRPGRSPEGGADRPVSVEAAKADLPPLECELVGAILDNPDLFGTDHAESLEKLLTSTQLRAIFQSAARVVEARGVVDAAALLASDASGAARPWLEDRLAIQKYDADGARHALRDGLPRLARQNIERQLPLLMERIKAARRQGDEERATTLTREHVELSRSAHRLMQVTKG